MINHKRKMSVAGHRGDSYNYFENTMTAFAGAYEAGADMIELDLRLTKDEELIIMHDSRVDRTTNGKGEVKDLTFDEIKELNAGNYLCPETVPSFEEFLLWVKDKELTVNIEIKEYYSQENEKRAQTCIEKTISLVEKYNMGERILINSFDGWVLEYVYKKYGKKYMLHGFYPYWELSNKTINPDEYLYCACIFEIDKKENFDYLISKGIEPWVGASVTQIAKLEQCINYGAKLVTTNNPRATLTTILELENSAK